MLAFLKEYKLSSEKAFLALSIIALCQETLFVYPVAVVGHIGPLSFLSKLIFPITYIILAIVSLRGKGVIGYVRGRDFGLFTFFAIYVIISTTLNPLQSQAISEALIPEILPCLPFFFLGLCLKIDRSAMNALGKWSCLAIILSSFYRFFYQVPDSEWEKDYNMGAAYSLLPNIMITINYAFHAKKKLIPIICSIVGIFYLFAMGTRGPIVIAVTLVFLCFVISSTKWTIWKVILSILIGILILCVITSPAFVDIFALLGSLLSSMGLSTRAVEFFYLGEFLSNTTGRDEIATTLISQLDYMPFWGYGVLAENRWNILSAHNLYIQAIFDYGYIFGGLFLVFLVYICVKALLKSKGKFTQQWILIWMVYVFVKGFFGGGVLRYEVFILIGLCLRVLRTKESIIQ